MGSSFISDVKTAANLFREIRKARKDGVRIEVQRAKAMEIPVIGGTVGFYSTVEGCRLANGDRIICDIAEEAFRGLSCEDKHRLTLSIQDGEFVERVYFWKTLFAPVMTPVQCRNAVLQILQWYIHIKQMRMER